MRNKWNFHKLNQMAYKYLTLTLLLSCCLVFFDSYSVSSGSLNNPQTFNANGNNSENLNNGWPPEWEVPSNTGNFGYCKIENIANPGINNIPLEDGDFIGVFWADAQGNHHCAGAGEWVDEGLLFAIFGDDSYTPVKDGLSYNEVLKFKFFDWSANKTYSIPTENVTFGSCSGCIPTGKWNGFGIYKVNNIFLNLNFDVVAIANPDTICISGETHLFADVWVGAGPYSFEWTSNPPGFNSTLVNPTFYISETTDFLITASNNSYSSNHHVKVVVNQSPVSQAGNDGSICYNGNFQISGDTANLYSSLLWTSSGDGWFTNPDILHPVYTPGPFDINSGSVKLYLSAFPLQGCSETYTDSLFLNIARQAIVNAGDDFPVCSTSPVQLNASASGYSSILWTRLGSGTPGTFNNPAILNPLYTLSTYDLASGLVSFNITIQPINPCTVPASDIISVTVKRAPTANAGTGGVICASSNFSVHGSATNYSSIYWTSNGDGYFVNPNILNTSYIPGNVDKLGGIKLLTLNVNPNIPCVNSVQSSLNLVIIPMPIVNAGADQQFIDITPIVLTGSASNASSVQWLTNGTGNFANSSQLSTSYFLSQEDLNADTIVLRLKVNSLMPCTLPVYDTLLLINGNFVLTVQTITIPVGWSGISTFIKPTDASLEAIFAPIVNDLVIFQNSAGIYWPSEGINTLGDWSEIAGYQIKMMQSRELTISGTNLVSREINLNSGWSFLPVLSECPVSVSAFLGSFNQVLIVKEIAGTGIYWPAQNINTIGNLLSGKSYMINISSNMTITYPECFKD